MIKKNISFDLLCFSNNLNSFVRDADKTVAIPVSGKTQDEAKQSALPSAIEQALGAFISSKTER